MQRHIDFGPARCRHRPLEQVLGRPARRPPNRPERTATAIAQIRPRFMMGLPMAGSPASTSPRAQLKALETGSLVVHCWSWHLDGDGATVAGSTGRVAADADQQRQGGQSKVSPDQPNRLPRSGLLLIRTPGLLDGDGAGVDHRTGGAEVLPPVISSPRRRACRWAALDDNHRGLPPPPDRGAQIPPPVISSPTTACPAGGARRQPPAAPAPLPT